MSLTSFSLKKRLTGRLLISVINQLHLSSPITPVAYAVKPCWAARPFGSTYITCKQKDQTIRDMKYFFNTAQAILMSLTIKNLILIIPRLFMIIIKKIISSTRYIVPVKTEFQVLFHRHSINQRHKYMRYHLTLKQIEF